ncbi:MAG: chloride channel protein [Chitinophagaceae bacterium]|nr:chloride channel protein [Oligoflexus sp.]
MQSSFRFIKNSLSTGAFWLLLLTLLSAVTGSVIALFLHLLETATITQWQHPALLFGLPFAGMLLAILTKKFGKGSDSGNDLLIEDLNQDEEKVPKRLAPYIFFATLITHLFGGSAGREGTAVQIGGSIAQSFCSVFKLTANGRALLILCGMSAGFGAVFGTPFAGAFFALEVVGVLRTRARSFIPILFASLLADSVCKLWSIHHTLYRIVSIPPELDTVHFYATIFLKIGMAAILFGLCSRAFAEATHGLKRFWNRLLPAYWMSPLLGGILIITLTYTLDSRAFLGLGITNPDPLAPSIIKAFLSGGVTAWSWLWKFIFTAITLSSGFKGGEATPLFFIGACLGAALAQTLGLPLDLIAGLGLVAVFAAATNTPLAGTIMGAELFGFEFAPYFFCACFIAYFCSGNGGVYTSQRWNKPTFQGRFQA